jgi:hypothetical protein
MSRHVLSLDEAIRMVRTEIMPKIEEAVIRGMKSSALLLEGKIVQEIDTANPYPAVDTGALRGSFQTKFTDRTVVVFSDLPYAAAMEFGTRPFFPPVDPIAEWVMRKGISNDASEAKGIAFAIAKKFSKQGIKPRFFTKKAIAKFTPLLKKEVEHAIDGI